MVVVLTLDPDARPGLLKREHAKWSPPVAALERRVKAAFDPKGLLNPGKKLPADDCASA